MAAETLSEAPQGPEIRGGPEGPGDPAQVGTGRSRAAWQRGLAVLLVVGISVAIVVYRKQLAGLGFYGYPGIFLVSLLGNATVILPAPSLAVVFAAGSSFVPVLVGLAAGTGEALGELTGYVAGAAGSAVSEIPRRSGIDSPARYARIRGWMERWGLWLIFVLSLIPNPFFDLAGISAGALGIPVWRFLLVCWAGKVLKTTLIAYTGARVIGVLDLTLGGP